MKTLAEQSCKSLPAGAKPLSDAKARAHLKRVPGWRIQEGVLTKAFSFKDHYEATAFVAAAAWISHRQDHHPDIMLGYNKVAISYSTHSVKGLSLNDFICAARVDALFK